MSDDIQPKLYSISKAATLLGVSKYTIKKYYLQGDLERINIAPNGKKPSYRITAESIEALLNRFKNQ